MEVFLDTKHQRLIVWNALDFVTPLPRNLNCCFHRFSTCVHWEHHVKSKHLRDELGEFGEDIVVESSTAQGQSGRLLNQCLDQLRVAVALVYGAVCGEKVEIVIAFLYAVSIISQSAFSTVI
jgi:hypothetical protein